MLRPSLRVWLFAIPVLYFLYFFGLTNAGLLGPDEPRYAAISREMARSGDWVTPRLWGEAWFEKPALLYWMQSAAFRAGLNDDLAPRVWRPGSRIFDRNSSDFGRMAQPQPYRRHRSSDVGCVFRGHAAVACVARTRTAPFVTVGHGLTWFG